MPLPDWNDNTNKSSRGKLLIVGGSRRLPGAVILAARAALRIGCGTVRVAVPESIATAMGVAVPELMILPLAETSHGTIAASAASKLIKEQMKVCSAIVLGPGIDEDKDTEKAIRELLEKASLPTVVDAQALFAYDIKQKPTAARILTPHEDEFKALRNGKEVDMTAPEPVANEFAQQSNAILVLKGQNTFIATPEGSVFKNEAGSRALGEQYTSEITRSNINFVAGTAGSGDTLAGIIGGLLAQGIEAHTAAIWGVYFHAIAGEIVSKEVGEDGAMASDFINRLPAIQQRLRQETRSKNSKPSRS
ncbi:unnamed protein product [Adineta ricciae]|uniref:ATP-dependent (S)-NAD(P)H-hydrate dehydratase n=1 Tax=Adineta ricciae TaxID=249248 RepID=A0A814KCT5_ADIRI|nr:unnamed protein product [Adineta ricciae]